MPKYKKCFLVASIAALLVVVWGMIIVKIYGTIEKDFLNDTVFTVFGRSYSWYPVSHFIWYFIVAFLFPDCHVFLVFVGIFWEIIEEISGEISERLWLIKNESIIDNDNERKKKKQYGRWCSGSFDDIIFNILGIYTAVAIRKFIKLKKS